MGRTDYRGRRLDLLALPGGVGAAHRGTFGGVSTTPDLTPETPVMGEPTDLGRFGEFGGQFVPETLVPALQELDRSFRSAWGDPEFRSELDHLLSEYAGRPSPVTECHRLSEQLGVRILFKREH